MWWIEATASTIGWTSYTMRVSAGLAHIGRLGDVNPKRGLGIPSVGSYNPNDVVAWHDVGILARPESPSLRRLYPTHPALEPRANTTT